MTKICLLFIFGLELKGIKNMLKFTISFVAPDDTIKTKDKKSKSVSDCLLWVIGQMNIGKMKLVLKVVEHPKKAV